MLLIITGIMKMEKTPWYNSLKIINKKDLLNKEFIKKI